MDAHPPNQAARAPEVEPTPPSSETFSRADKGAGAFCFNLLGLAHLFAGDIADAREAARVGLKSRPDSATLATTLSRCLIANGEHVEADRIARLVASLPPGAPDGLGPLWDNNPDWERDLLSPKQMRSTSECHLWRAAALRTLRRHGWM